jgi:glycosyltransferase involved in cell wall biosynthesis
MKISVIIPTYNREDFILKAIHSVLDQTFQADEIIVIDDGSQDNTTKILEPLIQTCKIKYQYQSNQGVSAARNRGIKRAKNEWLAFLDSDDLWHRDKLLEQTKFHKQNPTLLFSHTEEEWIRNHKILKQKKHHAKPQGECFIENLPFCKISPSTVLLHRSILNRVDSFDENLKVCEDYDLWLRILLHYPIGLVPKALTQKISNSQSQLSFDTPLLDSYRIKALEKHLHSYYQDSVKNEIIKKCEILIQGAKKHNNSDILETYTDLLLNIKS